jgi:rare lipoprotein A
VRVTNLQNHRQVIVKVNDRGPFHSNRIIDLSYAAAKKLGIADGGTGLVEVESINPDHYHRKTVYQRSYALKALEDHKDKDEASTNQDSKHEESAEDARLFIQVGAFASRDNARQLRQRLAQLPLQAPVHTLYSAQQNLYRVRIGPLDSVEQADRLTRLVTENGFDLPHVIVD